MTTAQDVDVISWRQFRDWARVENEYQKQIIGVHPADHPNAEARGRTYFDINVYRYFHAMQVCWPYLNRPDQKMLDVGSWPGAWLRAVAHFAARHRPQVWASGLLFPDDFLQKMDGACHGVQKCELDIWSPMHDREAPNVFTEKDFTFVSAMEVVEHLYHPGWMFKIIHDAMAPGGILFLTTNNVARLSNVFGLLTGFGTSNNLGELLPSNGGILGAWRPHAREYCWRELETIAGKAGFSLLSHGFYQENYCKPLIAGDALPSEELVYASEDERRFAMEISPVLAEPEQLKSGIYLVFRKAE